MRVTRHSALVLLCVTAMLLLSVLGKGASSCRFEGVGTVLLLKGNECPSAVCCSTAVLLFVLAKTGVSGHIANTAQSRVQTALRWGLSCMLVQSIVLPGVWSVKRWTCWSTGIENDVGSGGQWQLMVASMHTCCKRAMMLSMSSSGGGVLFSTICTPPDSPRSSVKAPGGCMLDTRQGA